MTTAQRNLEREMQAAQALKAALIATYDEDQIDGVTFRDAIEGETNLHEMIAGVMDSILECGIQEAGLREMITKLKARLDRVELQQSRLRACLEQALIVGEIKTMVLPDATITLKNTPPKVEIVNDMDIPAKFWDDRPPVLSRSRLSDALKAGETVPGATMSNGGVTLQIRR